MRRERRPSRRIDTIREDVYEDERVSKGDLESEDGESTMPATATPTPSPLSEPDSYTALHADQTFSLSAPRGPWPSGALPSGMTIPQPTLYGHNGAYPGQTVASSSSARSGSGSIPLFIPDSRIRALSSFDRSTLPTSPATTTGTTMGIVNGLNGEGITLRESVPNTVRPPTSISRLDSGALPKPRLVIRRFYLAPLGEQTAVRTTITGVPELFPFFSPHSPFFVRVPERYHYERSSSSGLLSQSSAGSWSH